MNVPDPLATAFIVLMILFFALFAIILMVSQ